VALSEEDAKIIEDDAAKLRKEQEVRELKANYFLVKSLQDEIIEEPTGCLCELIEGVKKLILTTALLWATDEKIEKTKKIKHEGRILPDFDTQSYFSNFSFANFVVFSFLQKLYFLILSTFVNDRTSSI